MNVTVRNLPDQMTQKQVRKYFSPRFEKLGIETYHCEKLRNKGVAILTILDVAKAKRFLDNHGQTEGGARGFRSVRQKLFHQSRPINCYFSHDQPDRFTIGSLQKEEEDRKVTALAPKQKDPPSRTARIKRCFQLTQLCCGQWDYSGGHLVFANYYQSDRWGSIFFDARGLFIQLFSKSLHFEIEPLHQLEIPYTTIQSFTVGSRNDPCITFSLMEAPRIFQKSSPDQVIDSNAIEALMSNFFIGENKRSPVTRKRVTSLDRAHRDVVSSCLCYRFQLQNPAEIPVVQSLKQFQEIPGSIRIEAHLSSKMSFTVQVSALDTALTQYPKVPFEVKFQLHKLARNGFLAPTRVVELLIAINQHITDKNSKLFVDAVYQLSNQIPFPGPNADASEFGVDTLMDHVKQNVERIGKDGTYLERFQQYEHIISVHKAIVTPTGVYLDGPTPEVKNRVLRKYSAFPSYFISVSFTEEDSEPLRHDVQTSVNNVYDDFRSNLQGHISIGGRKYEFLGFSHSSLRAHTCWFMATFTYKGSPIYPREVIKDLGDFSLIRSPAKCAARIGQAFSQTLSSISIPAEAIQIIPDVHRNGRTFSDGVGTCSQGVLQKIWDEYSSRRGLKPTIFQVRFQGAKGVLSLDSRLQGMVLRLRGSMIKFEGTNVTDIEICESATKPLPMYLNRQVIKILEDLGVKDRAFLDLQAEAVERLRVTTLSASNAATFLRRSHIGDAAKLPWLLRKLESLGLSFHEDDFLRSTLETAVLMQLHELKHRSRILVEQGWTLFGIMDETGILEEGEVYCSVHSDRDVDRGSSIITGDVVITRCPALHPGDIQCVRAVDVPSSCALTDLHNVVVFSSKGARDLPSQLSGGDLDGDLYNVIYDVNLYPPRLHEPADYAIIKPIDIERAVQVDDITEHFLMFMQNDHLGRIATLHQIIADQEPNGTLSKRCISIAGLHSDAVDFSKTGIPVENTRIPKYPKVRPDFQAPGPQVLIGNTVSFEEAMEREYDDDPDDLFASSSMKTPKVRYYESENVLGKLYRNIDETKFLEELQGRAKSSSVLNQNVIGDVWNYVRRNTALIQWEQHRDTANEIRERHVLYEENVIDTMLSFSSHPSHFVSEIEVCSGSILGKNGAQSKRQREYSVDMKEKHNRDVEYTVRCIKQGDSEDGSDEALERSIACLFASLHRGRKREKVGTLVSFGWVAAAICLQEVEKFQNPKALALTKGGASVA